MIHSNHTLHDMSLPFTGVIYALEDDDIDLLNQSLHLNCISNEMLIVRHKILWSHVRGNLNLGDSSIVTHAMPQILG